MRSFMVLGVFMLALMGCGQAQEIAVADVRNDREGLAALINLPAQPTQVAWLSQPLGIDSGRVPGPTDLELHAVVTFAPADLEAIRQQAIPLGGVVQWSAKEFKPWYPPTVRDSFQPDGAMFNLTVPLYDADPIFGQNNSWRGTFFITPSGDLVLILRSF